ncbi:centrosomal protein of 131 kDa isoform X2 [Dasypus novemcinctus]|uniref:centrosomal protein of 131 kDa isoform X2 n=1 Tax=Dasypus novemcinctus TaxID=9361 RepID=UPI00265DAB27|nr:centrosomal protein of 131 kDa isoform X2 [Dasypus novemcinctus]
MKGSRATSGPPGPPEGSPEGVDLSLTGLPPPVSRRPRSASAARPVARPVSVVAGSELRRRAPDAMGPRGPRAINNLRRSNSTTLASRPSSGALSPPSSLGGLRPAEPTNFLTLFEGSPGGRKRPAGPSHARSAQGAAGNVLDEPPSAPALPPSTPAQPTAPWRKERTVALAPSFTANNRPLLPSPGQRAWGWSEGFWSSKRAAGNCVPSMVHNHCGPPERPPPPESAPRAAPPLNNVVAAAAGEALEGSGPGRPQKVPGSTRPDRSHARGPPGLLRRKEVTEEEAERFILQVNQAAVIIQRWYRRQVQRRRAGAAGLQRLLASKREERRRPGEGGVLDLRREKEAERRKAREEQARQARRAAIEELQQGRTRQAGDGAAGLPQERRALGGPRAAQELHPEPRDAAPRALQANNAGANSCPACPEDPRQPASSSSPDAVPEPRQSPEDKPQVCPAAPASPPTSGTGPRAPAATPWGHPAGRGWRPPEGSSGARGSSCLGAGASLLGLHFGLPWPPGAGAGASSSEAAKDAGSPETASEDPMVAGSRAKAHVALRLLLDTLRLLEEEPEPLPHPKAWPQGRLAWTDRGDSSSLTADNLEQLGRLGGPPEDGALLSEAKLHSILSFLGEMEGAGRGGNPAAPAPREGLGPGEEPARPGPASEASVSVLRLTQEVEEKRRAAALLQQALAQQQDLAARRVAETREALGRQLRQQQGRYEATIRRHLTFIDQLIEDKKVLTERCEAVVAELRQVDERCKARVAQVQEQHEQETKKLKDLMSATEKVRREKWINEKTRKIKEMTVKGLEPEIQRLIAKHKQELKALKGLHEAELLRAEERAAQRYAQQAEELRERLEREKAALGQRERELAQQRLEQHLEQEQRALEQQRRRLHSEVAEERERLGQQAARQRVELEELRRQLEESSSAASRALRAEFEKGREEQERRHQAELEALKDQLEVEKQAWGASYAKREEAWLLAREQELKEELRKGRDREIELVIRRLEADTALAKEESERSAESRVKRLRDKYETELAELERSEHGLQERCAELRARLGEAEGQRGRLQVLLRQREEELEGAKAVNAQLLGERSGLAQVVRQEFADRLAASEEEARRARAELAELRARQHVELERLMREKEEELQEVHRRVKTAVARKEETLRGLRQQHEAALKRAEHLEELLERQRQPLATT